MKKLHDWGHFPPKVLDQMKPNDFADFIDGLLERRGFEIASEEAFTTNANVRLPVHENRTNFKHNDLLVPWKNKSDEETFHRFYHVFEEGELESLMYEALGKDKMEIESLFYDQGNWCVIFVKKQ